MNEDTGRKTERKGGENIPKNSEILWNIVLIVFSVVRRLVWYVVKVNVEVVQY